MDKKEYKERISALLREMVKVETRKGETAEFLWGKSMRRTSFRMCNINGTKYVVASDICHGFADKRNTFMNNGVLKESDFLYLLTYDSKGAARCFIKAEALYNNREELSKMCVGQYDPQAPLIPVAVAATYYNDLPVISVDNNVLSRSQEAYKERLALMAEDREQSRRMHQENRERWLQEEEEKKAHEHEHLKDLVREIEDMGWHVSLTLKENG